MNRYSELGLGYFFGKTGEKVGDREASLPPDHLAVEGRHAILRALENSADIVIGEDPLIEQLVEKGGEDCSAGEGNA